MNDSDVAASGPTEAFGGWLLLIYSLPSQPSRKRAYVWRELKKLGAVYLRDGVALLPRRPDLEHQMRAIVERVHEYEGTGDLIVGPDFAGNRDAEFTERFQEERASEYRELYHACVRFLRDVLDDVSADDFGFPDVDKLESELQRLHRWHEQIVERDYFTAPGSCRVIEILAKCDRAFEQFASTASDREDHGRRAHDDVFERLGGAAAEAEADLPL